VCTRSCNRAPLGDSSTSPLDIAAVALLVLGLNDQHRRRKVISMDEDLDTLTSAQLLAEVKRLRAGIRAHRDSTGHDLCWYHPELWALLPERPNARPWVPTWPKFMAGCIRYRESLDRQLADAPRRDLGYGESDESSSGSGHAGDVQQSLEGSVMRFWLGASGAERLCALGAFGWRFYAAPHR
jgi:hypothetical protein